MTLVTDADAGLALALAPCLALAGAVGAKTPRSRIGTPADVEGAGVELTRNAARHHTGDPLVIDVGRYDAD